MAARHPRRRWWYISEGSSRPFFPPLAEILKVFSENWIFDRVRPDLIPSLTRFLGGFVIAVVLGIASGCCSGCGRSPGVRWSRRSTSCGRSRRWRSCPSSSSCSASATCKVTVIAFAAFFPILLNTIDGVRSVEPIQLDLARAYKVGFRQKVFRIILPAASPQIFAGLRISLAVALLVMAFARCSPERTASASSSSLLRPPTDPRDVVGIVLLGAIGYLVNLVFSCSSAASCAGIAAGGRRHGSRRWS